MSNATPQAIILAVLAVSLVTGPAFGSSERTPRSSAAVSGQPACEILDDSLIRAHFTIEAGVEVSRTPSRHSPHPLCTASWRKPDAAEIEARMGQAMNEYMQKKLRGEDVEMPSARTTDEVSLTLFEPPSESHAVALADFDGAMQMLVEGMSHSDGDVTVTLQADLVPVESVGDKAMWAARLHQLSVVSGTRIFHVTVHTGAGDDADRASAAAIGRQVAEGF